MISPFTETMLHHQQLLFQFDKNFILQVKKKLGKRANCMESFMTVAVTARDENVSESR